MINYDQCVSGLNYKGFSVVYIQAFSLSRGNHFDKTSSLVEEIDHSIDHQIFNLRGFASQQLIKRYKLRGFNILIKLDEDDGPLVEGCVHVEASLFFDNTVTISYRLVVDSEKQLSWEKDQFCVSDSILNTDQLIALAGIPLSTEHWNLAEGADRSEIDSDIDQIRISEIWVGDDATWLEAPTQLEGKKREFSDVQSWYKRLFTGKKDDTCDNDYFYVYIDVWENIEHEEGVDFRKMGEDEIIAHIENITSRR